MKNKIPFTVGSVLPHSGPMVLLDQITEHGDDYLEAQVVVSERLPLHDGNGVPAFMGLEFMAQAIAAWAGVQQRKAGQMPRLGFLCAVRQFQSSVNQFRHGDVLIIRAEEVIENAGLAVFDCGIKIHRKPVAQARLSVFSGDISAVPGH